MRSFQADHEARQQEQQEMQAAAASTSAASPTGASPGSPSSADQRRPSPPKRAGSPGPVASAVVAAAAAGAAGGQRQGAGSPAGSPQAAGAAAAATASNRGGADNNKPDEVAAFRTNITIAVMVMCGVLMGIIAMNSGTNEALTHPRALVFIVDGPDAAAVRDAVGQRRAPFIGMLAEIGSSSLGLDVGTCTRSVGPDMSSEQLVLEVLSGSPAGNGGTIAKAAKTATMTVGLVGDYPLVDDRTAGCGVLNTECASTCQKGDAASRCNFDSARVVRSPEEVGNATYDLFRDEMANLVVVRVPYNPIADTVSGNNQTASAESKASALFLVDAAIGRSVMRVLERTGTENENLLVVIVAAPPDSAASYLGVTAFKGANTVGLNAMTPYPRAPSVGDAAAIVATWLGFPAPAASRANVVLCGTGSAPASCSQA